MDELQSNREYLQGHKIAWIDIFKGICIILMVMGHAGAPFITYIYLFHMPAFIVISGYTYSGHKYSLFKYLSKKIRTLLLPTLCINLCYIMFYVLLQKLGLYSYFQNGESISLINRVKILVHDLGTTDLGGATWFIFVLFTIEILFKICSDICFKIKAKGIDIYLSFVLSMFGSIFIAKKQILPYMFDLSLYGLCFFTIGVFLKRIGEIDEKIDKKIMIKLSLIVVVFFGGIFFKGELPMNWPTRQFAVLPIQLLSSLCAIYLCYCISKFLEKSTVFKTILSYIGKRTYSILVLHFFTFRLIFFILIMFKVFPIDYLKELTPRYSNGIQWLLISMMSIIICMIISKISEKLKILDFLINAKIPNSRMREVSHVSK